MQALVVSTSLNKDSKSRVLAKQVYEALSLSLDEGAGDSKVFADLVDYPLPLCDGGAAYGDPNVAKMAALIGQSQCIIVAFPVYNYTCSAALKNLIELTGRAWENKVVSFVCAAGGKSSYMSVMSIASSLMLDFRSVIVPRFVYSDPDAYSEINVQDSQMHRRLRELAATSVHMAKALN